MIRKEKYILLVLMLILSFSTFVFVGCGDSKENKEPEKKKEEKTESGIEDSDSIRLKPYITDYIGMKKDEISEEFDGLGEDTFEMLGHEYYSNNNTSNGVMFFAFENGKCFSVLTDMSYAFYNYNIELSKDEITSMLGGTPMESNEVKKYEEALAVSDPIGIISGKFSFVISASDPNAVKTDDLICITKYDD